ncbi:MAG TPA: hypothetical protein VNI20_08640 [Fimbriimonadaceae bacterium]|nr:hypothetical protein [Fimbriimonadaceae bacterium]
MSGFPEAVVGFLIALVLGPVTGFSIITIIKWMLNNEIEVAVGLTSIAIMLVVAFLTIMSKSAFMAGTVLTVMITLMAFFPYAMDQLAQAELQGSDIDKLDRIHREIIARPGNVSTYFALAEVVYDLGLEGHAIVIAENTLNRLSTEIDPIKNQSMRDVFSREDSRTRQWRRMVKDDSVFRPVACPRCGQRNEPGSIACSKCQGPFLLDLARKIDPREKIRTRLVFGWALVVLFFTGTVYTWSVFSGMLKMVSLTLGLGMVGATFTYLFRRRTLRDK